MSISTGATDVVGGGYPTAFAGYPGAGFGGLGGVGLFGLIGLNSFLGGNGWGNGFGNGWGAGGPFPGAGFAGTTVADQNISELRKDVQGVATTVEAKTNDLTNTIYQQTLGQTSQFTNLGDLVMNGFAATAPAAKDATIQGILNTQSIKDQAANFQVVNQENFCQIKAAINADGDATRALINTNLIEGLRAELVAERRSRDLREIEINVTQTNQQTQNQLQAQLQAQSQAIGNALNMLGDQINRQTNSMINLGTMTGNAQTATNANTKVNS